MRFDIFGDMDDLAWDLGNPAGELLSADIEVFADFEGDEMEFKVPHLRNLYQSVCGRSDPAVCFARIAGRRDFAPAREGSEPSSIRIPPTVVLPTFGPERSHKTSPVGNCPGWSCTGCSTSFASRGRSFR